MNTTFKVPLWLLALVVLFVLGLCVSNYVTAVLYQSSSGALADLRSDVSAKNQEAADKLADLTDARDKEQVAKNKQAEKQEVTDAERLAEIDRLNGELRDRPFRVRYITASSGAGSGGPASGAATSTYASTEDTATASGVLPAENSRRLAVALNEIEEMSAAYSSCRERLIPTQSHDSPQSG